MKKSIVIAIVILVLAFGLFLLKTQTPKHPNVSLALDSSLQELEDEEYQKIKNQIETILADSDPRAAIAYLASEMKNNPAVLRSCHSLVHSLGHSAYDKYGDFGTAMVYQDELCNSGYIHGIIELHFSKGNDIFAQMETVCDPYPFGKFMSFECFHGVGHGLMYYTENDLPKSLAYCDAFASSFARMNCANGVYMENFNADQKLHVSKFLNKDDPFYPCRDQVRDLKGTCYLYAPTYYLSLNKNDYEGALRSCLEVESAHRDDCAEGVGGQAIKENIDNPIFVENICLSGSIEQRNPCIRGFVSLYINHFGGLNETRKLCFKLRFSNRQTCLSTLKSRISLFN